jgi:Mannosylglycerate hydrolase MGH1-like glycoside hydrolase domain
MLGNISSVEHGTDLMTALKTTAENVLLANWSGDHMVPSRTLYPHQWSWDAAFISIGLVQIAPDRAWQELRSLFDAQWPDGRVPHIVFDPGVPEKEYFPGPAFWEVPPIPGKAVRTTGIVQPPVHALAALLVHRAHPDQAALKWLYPRLVAQQEYLAKHRDAGGAGLACIVHPWESGLDNSPAWDATLARIPADTTVMERYTRHDTAVSVVSHRPTNADYCRFIALAQAYRDNGYRDFDLLERHPFVVECPAFNTLYADAEHVLAEIASIVGADPAPHRERAAFIRRMMQERLYNAETGMFHALDVRTHELSPSRCISGLLPLILPDLPAPVASSLVEQAASARFGFPGPLPSYDRTAPDFDALRYWRGPTWINVNWLMLRGLRSHGYLAEASALRNRMLELIARSGCYEYFDPITGQGIGTAEFSWTAALALDMLAS